MHLPPASPDRLDPANIWRHRQPKGDQPIVGRLVGPHVPTRVHNEKQDNGSFYSKPCRYWATKGRVRCRHELCLPTQRFQAYVPVLTKDEAVVVIVGAKMHRKLLSVPLGSVLRFRAASRKGQPTTVEVFDEGTPLFPGLPKKPDIPHDITEYLLRILWGDVALWRYLTGPFRLGANGYMPAELESESVSIPDPLSENHSGRSPSTYPRGEPDEGPGPAPAAAAAAPAAAAPTRNGKRRR